MTKKYRKRENLTEKQRPELTPEYLKKYAEEHLYYEFLMFKQTATIIFDAKGFSWLNDNYSYGFSLVGLVNNTLTESCATHSRNLLEFFFMPPKLDDIRATNYIDNKTEWATFVNRFETTKLKDMMERTNKEIAHITAARSEVEVKTWMGSIRTIKEDFLVPATIQFLKVMKQDLIPTNFRDLLESYSEWKLDKSGDLQIENSYITAGYTGSSTGFCIDNFSSPRAFVNPHPSRRRKK